ncbi:hypothetical protein PTSG_11905 [Salpingoeca rosetta]|uniref:Uncharacterized protein n=1 Tax=Salpingoeca rosetta (strain ATCC 50818 / BSB-021) TaxID=946362 RepID=F2U313_SALR5|nr:uncharacterized protein PTSG_11905 [Salpingoeca rosetta]EGD82007.1 hypothetical protein PTSG_11905 [Salpingoeca rosetta]|eukprot:XP_004996190.1 hypothetical protein PTSG_11905 [Salpingoeca rosetta]
MTRLMAGKTIAVLCLVVAVITPPSAAALAAPTTANAANATTETAAWLLSGPCSRAQQEPTAWVGVGCSAQADSCTSVRSSIHALLRSIQSREQHCASSGNGDSEKNGSTELSHLRTIEAFVNQYCPPPTPPSSPPPAPPRLPTQPPRDLELEVQRVRRASTTTKLTTTTTTTSTTTTVSTRRARRFTNRAVVCTLTRSLSTPYDCTNPRRDAVRMLLKIEGNGSPLPSWDESSQLTFQSNTVNPTTPTNLIIEGSVFLEDLVWLLQFRWDTVTNITIRGYEGVEFPLAVLNAMTNVHTIDLAGNDITRLVPTNAAVDNKNFTLGDSITTLDVTRNSLSELPQATLAAMPNLTHLTWDGNQLAEIEPGVFAATTNLTTLSLRDNRILNVVAGTFAHLNSLRDLDLSDNRISSVAVDAFAGLFSVVVLHLNDNRISSVVAHTFADLVSLRELDLSNNRISSIAAFAFAGLTSLVELHLGNNTVFEVVADAFADLSSLPKLDLSNNRISNVSALAFADLTSLTELRLSNNRISSIVENAFSGLTSLMTLDVHFNRISTLDENALISTFKLESLNLDHNPVDTFPPRLFVNLTRLSHLRLTSTRATTLPTSLFEHNTRLRELWLFHNRFTEIEVGTFDKLTRLVFLTLTGNDITHLPSMLFARLTRLKELYISNNDVRTVDPNAFRGLESLTTLTLVRNRINDLHADTFTTATALENVDLSDNDLTILDHNLFGSSPRLTELVLSGNHLTQFDHLPLPGLKALRIHDNPLVEQPDTGIFPSLATLSMNNHHVPWVNFTLVFVLPYLTTLEMSADPSFGVARMLPIPEIEARTISATPVNNDDSASGDHNSLLPLRVLDVRNIELLSQFDQVARSHRLRLTRFAAGWPGMTNATIPSDLLCHALDNIVDEFTLTNTGYTSIDLCPNNEFRAVFLHENAHLHTVHIHNPLQQLSLFRSEKMETLLLPRADVIDLSYTNVAAISQLCQEWGLRALFYRGVRNPLLKERGQELLRRCLRNAEVATADGCGTSTKSRTKCAAQPSSRHSNFKERIAPICTAAQLCLSSQCRTRLCSAALTFSTRTCGPLINRRRSSPNLPTISAANVATGTLFVVASVWKRQKTSLAWLLALYLAA